MKYELKRIDIWPVVKVVFILSLLLGFFIGILYAGLFLLMDAFTQLAAETGFADINSFGGGFALFALFGCTFGISFFYTVGAVIFIVLYNLLAGSIGGIRFELESLENIMKDRNSVG